MENISKIRKIAISDDTQQKALILAAKYNLAAMANKKIDLDEVLAQVIESAINYQFEHKYLNDVVC